MYSPCVYAVICIIVLKALQGIRSRIPADAQIVSGPSVVNELVLPLHVTHSILLQGSSHCLFMYSTCYNVEATDTVVVFSGGDGRASVCAWHGCHHPCPHTFVCIWWNLHTWDSRARRASCTDVYVGWVDLLFFLQPYMTNFLVRLYTFSFL